MAQLTNTATLLRRTMHLLRPATTQQSGIVHKSTNSSNTTTTTIEDLDLEALNSLPAAASSAEDAAAAAFHDAEHAQLEATIERSRNKSRLLPQHRNMLNNQRPYEQAQSWIHNTVKYQRMQFGRLGLASGVDPAICFATPAETATRAEYERVAHPESLAQMMERSRTEVARRKAVVVEREEQIAKKLGKLDAWMADLNAKVAKREADALAARARKERLVEEVRRQFGFKMDARDERFQELLAQKEKEDKKRQKEEKKKAKDERMLAKLQEKHAAEFVVGEKPPAQV